ncbi:MAG: beta-N-acetylhexosaminidase [Bdellovibrionia bacterium]
MVVFRLLVLALSLTFTASLPLYAATSTNDEAELGEKSDELTPDSILGELTLDQKIGQMFFFGFKGQEYNFKAKSALKTVRPGGLVVFRKNISSAEQISNFNHAAQTDFIEKNTVPVFIAIDQEGGNVTRIKSKPPLPSALALGQTNNRDIVGRMGFYTGTLMKALGFNMNLAPVLDISNPERPSFIGTRSFSGDPETVSRMAYAFAQGLQMAGIVPTLKHYPGHGGPAADSHKEIPVSTEDLNSLMASHIKPFSFLTSKLEVPAIMVAHVVYPNIDREPATYSRILIDDVLRKRLKYDGLVITDDIDMAGAKKFKDPGEQAIRAVEAGVDMIMVAWHNSSQTRAFFALKAAVNSGRVKPERIDASVRRILDVKLRYGLFNKPPTPSMKTINTIFSDPSFKRAADRVMAANIERSFQTIQVERPYPPTQKINIFGQTPRFFDAFVNGSTSNCCQYTKLDTLENLTDKIKAYPDRLNLVYVAGMKTLSIAARVPNSLAKKLVLVNTAVPGAIHAPQRYLGVINIYSPNPNSGEAIAKYLYSEPAPEMREPASDDEDDGAAERGQDSASLTKNLTKKPENADGGQHTRSN